MTKVYGYLSATSTFHFDCYKFFLISTYPATMGSQKQPGIMHGEEGNSLERLKMGFFGFLPTNHMVILFSEHNCIIITYVSHFQCLPSNRQGC